MEINKNNENSPNISELDQYKKMSIPEQKDPSNFLKLVSKIGAYQAIAFGPDFFRTDDTIAKIAVQHGCYEAFQYFSETIRANKEIALVSVRERGRNVQYCSKELKNDKEIVMEGIKENAYALKFASYRLKQDPELISLAAKRNPAVVGQIKKAICNRKDAAIAAVSASPDTLIYFNKKLWSDKDVQNAMLDFSNPNNMRSVLLNNAYIIPYLEKSLWIDDKALVRAALVKDSKLLEELPEKYKDDAGCIMAAANCLNCVCVLRYASDRLCDDKKTVSYVLKRDGQSLEYVSDRLKNERDIVMMAVKDIGWAIEFAPPKYKDDYEIVKRAVKNSPEALQFASERLKRIYKKG